MTVNQPQRPMELQSPLQVHQHRVVPINNPNKRESYHLSNQAPVMVNNTPYQSVPSPAPTTTPPPLSSSPPPPVSSLVPSPVVENKNEREVKELNGKIAQLSDQLDRMFG